MEQKRKRGRPPGSGKKKEVVGPFNPDKLQEEFDKVFKPKNLIKRLPEQIVIEKEMGTLVVDDPLLAASLARNPKCESAKDHTPFPDNWDSLSKIAKLQWLTEHRK